MKQGIHPDYKEVEVICACGETFKTKAVKDNGQIKVEICKNCHPFYTGVRRVIDTGGRVERFNKRYSR
ncbi:MAG: 50S ribosomal protein L31 [Tenericutes bacterium HGW-Tenericutes-4]|nr:MAG: 50S ribosomal protein L31 [Tenericutes bacterium HGW-Tenericutes-4]